MQNATPTRTRHYANGSARRALHDERDAPAAHETAPTTPDHARGTNPLAALLRLGGWLYAGAMFVYLLLRRWPGERLAPVAFANSFAHILVLPALLLLPVTLALRWFKLAAALFRVSVVAAAWYGPYALPRRPRPAPASAPRLTLLTFNQRVMGHKAADLARVIREADADVVAMQELHPDSAALFERELADLYPYRALHPHPTNVFHGQGVLSRYPILESSPRRTEMGHQRVRLDMDGRRVVLYNVHAAYPFVRGGFHKRRQNIGATGHLAQDEPDPVLLAGDFNMTPQSGPYAMLREAFGDAYRTAGRGLGFTYRPEGGGPHLVELPLRLLDRLGWEPGPLARIDYVFHDEHWLPQSAQVWPDSGGSDHYPIKAVLALRDD